VAGGVAKGEGGASMRAMVEAGKSNAAIVAACRAFTSAGFVKFDKIRLFLVLLGR
jgi:hypothetical protein